MCAQSNAPMTCLLLLPLLLAGAGSLPGVPGRGKGRFQPSRAGSLALTATRRGGGSPSRIGISPSPGVRRSSQRSVQQLLSAAKTELGPLAHHFGKFRLLVLAAPDPSDNSYRLMEKQIDVRSKELRCQLAERDLLILVLFHGATASQGKLMRVSQEGKVSEEKVEPEAVGQITKRLSLEEGQFSMVLLRKTMQLYERFPYAVRMEAVLETVDQMPLRKVESMTRRGQQVKCKGGGAGRLGSRQLNTSSRSPVNRSLVNRTLVNRTLVNRSLVNRTLVNRSLVNRSPVNRTLVNRTLVNRSLVNRSPVNRTLVNRNPVNWTLVNSRLRSASPNSQKPIRSQGVRFPGKPVALAPEGRRTPGKQKDSTSPPSSTGERRAETSRTPAKPRGSPSSPVPPGLGKVASLKDQIKQRVQQMLAANLRHPVQRRPNGSQVSRNPRVQSTGSTPVTSGRAPQNRSRAGTARGLQPSGSETAGLKWDRSQLSTAQQVKDRNPERAGIPQSKPSTVRSQDGLPTRQTLATEPSPPAHHPTESGGWGYGSLTTPATRPGLLPPSNAPGWATPIQGKVVLSPVTHPQEESAASASSPESDRARGQLTEPPIGNTLPKPPGLSVIEGSTRDQTTRAGQQEGRGLSQDQETPPSARPKGKKLEGEQGENSGKGVRNKGRKNRRNRKNKKGGSRSQKQTPRRELAEFLDHFRNRRRLLLVTAPSKDSELYVQQRDQYLENVCQLAIRRISVITILGSLSNSTLKVEHYQTENESSLGNSVPGTASVDLIAQLRREFGMTFDEFFMVFVEYDMKVKQYFDVPIPIKVLVDYMDTLPSRQLEIQEDNKNGVTCVKQDSFVNINKFLSRLQWKRRLLIISSPDDEEWTFQQQITTVHGQACNMGIRHFALLKLMGSGEDASGSLELFPLNGRTQTETEELSSMAVKGLRDHFRVSEDHFMMLLIGKDGTIKSWYLSPMWSLAVIYDQVDSMQLRQEEMKLQEALGIYCQEDEYSLHYRGYPEHG
ncbi:coiled-coil domain-containing protein 80-like [Heptranchias perlo]|uniref:coiled-coil domain-containing protein 80-like n=1 Tax=Heptranchias perlo TaxID=212740 RepID=UPI003559D291